MNAFNGLYGVLKSLLCFAMMLAVLYDPISLLTLDASALENAGEKELFC